MEENRNYQEVKYQCLEKYERLVKLGPEEIAPPVIFNCVVYDGSLSEKSYFMPNCEKCNKKQRGMLLQDSVFHLIYTCTLLRVYSED